MLPGGLVGRKGRSALGAPAGGADDPWR